MNPFLQQVLGTIVRTVVVWLAGKVGAEVSDDQVTQITAQVVPVLLVLGWSLWQKYRNRQKLLTALGSSHRLTEHEVEAMVSAGEAPTITTPKTAVPI